MALSQAHHNCLLFIFGLNFTVLMICVCDVRYVKGGGLGGCVGGGGVVGVCSLIFE